MYLCQEYHPHHFATGNPMSRAHNCEEPSITIAITTYLEKNPEFWTNLPWACLYCGMVNHGTDHHCTNQVCKEETGASREFVLANILSKIDKEITHMGEAEEAIAEIWPIKKAIQVILSPHNREYCGLLTGAFRAPDQDENACVCCQATDNSRLSLDLSSPDPAFIQPHSSTSKPVTLPSHLPSTSTTTILPSPPDSYSSLTLSPLNPLALPFSPPGTSTTTTILSLPGTSSNSTPILSPLYPLLLPRNHPVTSTTTTPPSPPVTSSPPTISPPAPALSSEPLQALVVDDTVMEAMDTDAEEPPYHHNYTPHMAEHDRLMEERMGGRSDEGRRMTMDLVHLGTNGLLTFPPHTTPLESLPAAMVTPTVKKEESSDDSSEESFDWLEDILLQEEEDVQQDMDSISLSPYTLEQLLALSDNEEEMVTLTATTTASITVTQAAPITPPVVTPIDASNATYRHTDVRLRMSQPQPAPITNTNSPSLTSHHTSTAITNPTSSTYAHLGARPRTSTSPPRRAPPPQRRLRRALLPLPPTTRATNGPPASCPAQLFWWCCDSSCGRANSRHRTHCAYCRMENTTVTSYYGN